MRSTFPLRGSALPIEGREPSTPSAGCRRRASADQSESAFPMSGDLLPLLLFAATYLFLALGRLPWP